MEIKKNASVEPSKRIDWKIGFALFSCSSVLLDIYQRCVFQIKVHRLSIFHEGIEKYH